MNRFASLWDQLTLATVAADCRLLVRHYLAQLAPADRGLALTLLTSGRLPGQGRLLKPAIKAMIDARIDQKLIQLSADHVGDFNETVALLWPADPLVAVAPTLGEVADALTGDKTALPGAVAGLLGRLTPAGRHLVLRIAGGRLRGVIDSPSIIDLLAQTGRQPVDAVAEAWHAAEPPYAALLAWLMDGAARPRGAGRLAFRPLIPWALFDEAMRASLRPADYSAAPAWDGIRVVLAGDRRRLRIFDATGADISARCPSLTSTSGVDGVFDAVLMTDLGNNELVYPDMSKRSVGRENNLKAIVYDVLLLDDEDLRDHPLETRLVRLARLFADGTADTISLAPRLAFDDWATLDPLRQSNEAGRDGILVRSRSGSYRAAMGSECRHWRRPALTDLALVLYAERDGEGDLALTVGLGGADGFPAVGRITVADKHSDMAEIESWIDANVTDRFGPIRQLKQGLVVELSYRGLKIARRRKAGIELREPVFIGARWDCTIDRVARVQDLL